MKITTWINVHVMGLSIVGEISQLACSWRAATCYSLAQCCCLASLKRIVFTTGKYWTISALIPILVIQSTQSKRWTKPWLKKGSKQWTIKTQTKPKRHVRSIGLCRACWSLLNSRGAALRYSSERDYLRQRNLSSLMRRRDLIPGCSKKRN